ncbi:MBL fold metallo-hydrolase [Chloroflexota bacterium]
MEIVLLGAHNLESANTRLVSILVDGILAIDAGSITSALTFKEQQKLEAILLTHRHFDHIRDLATLGLANIPWGTKKLYSVVSVFENLQAHIMNGIMYPDLTRIPSPEAPSFQIVFLEPHKTAAVSGYKVLPVPVTHTVPTVGYEITDGNGSTFFFSADTTKGLSDSWEHISSPQLLIIETTSPNSATDFAIKVGHLTPQLLKNELIAFKEIKGYLPRTIVVHMNPTFEEEIGREIRQVSQELDAEIMLGYEGMKIIIEA